MGLHNGSAGVQFVSNHDGGGADMSNVAYATILTQPGKCDCVLQREAVWHRPGLPVDGRGDALGNYTDKITDLLNIRETHGRGDLPRTLAREGLLRDGSGATTCSCCSIIAMTLVHRT